MKFKLFLIFALFIVATAYAQETFSNLIEVSSGDSEQQIIEKAAHIVPTQQQFAYLEREYISFIHFGVNTFTKREWGTGFENAALFAPGMLDTDQWCRIMKEAGMTTVVLTAKHHDGFCLWQTRYTDHSVASSPDFQDGKGDVLKELSQSAVKYGLKLGVYLSPADLYHIENEDGLYGNLSEYTQRTIPATVEGRPFKDKRTFQFNVDDYNEYFLNQLFELLTEYGPVYEVWFDGAHPKRKGGQTYTYSAWYELIRELAPEAVIFGKGPDVRWCGNEGGDTRESEWNVIPLPVHPDQFDWPDMTGRDLGSIGKLKGASYLYYVPAETNTSIRHGWFYRDDELQQVRSAADIVDIYERSVGGNSVFMLNIPPNRQGRFSPRDEAALIQSGKRILDTYSSNLIDTNSLDSKLTDSDQYSFVEENSIEFVVKEGEKVNRLVLEEATPVRGQRIEQFSVEQFNGSKWVPLAKGTTIGYKKIVRFDTIQPSKIRLNILKSRLTPSISEVGLYFAPDFPPAVTINRTRKGLVNINLVSSNFSWKSTGVNDDRSDIKIYYTLDGSTPEPGRSLLYSSSFVLPKGGRVKAVAWKENVAGSEAEKIYGLTVSQIKLKKNLSSKSAKGFSLKNVMDGDVNSYWLSSSSFPASLVYDLKSVQNVKGFSWLPPQGLATPAGMVASGRLEVSQDCKNWQKAADFEFGNVINDPTLRTFYLSESISARYVRWVAISGAGDNQIAGAAELELLVE